MTPTLTCIECLEPYPESRWFIMRGDSLRRVRCMDCAQNLPPPIRTVAHLHKSNAILITNPADLVGINNKGGLVK